jgi:hypothetical protein
MDEWCFSRVSNRSHPECNPAALAYGKTRLVLLHLSPKISDDLAEFAEHSVRTLICGFDATPLAFVCCGESTLRGSSCQLFH